MILPFPPGTPALVRSLTQAALVLHIGGASIGLISGAVALAARKGARVHRWAGHVFFVAMVTMGAMAICVALPLRDVANMIAGAFTVYLVSTAWATVRRGRGAVGRFEAVALTFAFAAAALGLIGGLRYAASPTPFFAIPSFLMAGVAALAGGADLKMVLRGGLTGADRLSRHLWRMCVGLFIATGSFFLGKQADMPHFVRGSPVLILLAFAPLLAMVWWLIRVRGFARRRAPAVPPAVGAPA